MCKTLLIAMAAVMLNGNVEVCLDEHFVGYVSVKVYDVGGYMHYGLNRDWFNKEYEKYCENLESEEVEVWVSDEYLAEVEYNDLHNIYWGN